MVREIIKKIEQNLNKLFMMVEIETP